MLKQLINCAFLGLAACAGSGGTPQDSSAAADAMADAIQDEPGPPPVPLAPSTPAARLQSEIARLSPRQLANWILPAAEAGEIVAAELLRGHMPRIGGISLQRSAMSTLFPGLCERQGYDVWLRVPDESSLEPAEHLDPPLQPYQYTPTREWKVQGSTIAERTAARPHCVAASVAGGWFAAPSAAAAHRAVSAVERAQRSNSGARLVCRQLVSEEGRSDLVSRACTDARALLRRLTPDLIKRVRRTNCGNAGSSDRCLGSEYHDPAPPGTHSFYLVTIAAEGPVHHLDITQGMLPPG